MEEGDHEQWQEVISRRDKTKLKKFENVSAPSVSLKQIIEVKEKV